jgi:uncharacterized protein
VENDYKDMPINAHPEFLAAEKVYINAETREQKIAALKKMISHAPGHKGAENLRAQLKRRLARFKYANEKEAKQKKGGKVGIKKEEMQAVLIGKTGVGKSWLLNELTNARPRIAKSKLEQFTTKKPIVGMTPFQGTSIQLIELPAIESEFFDKGIAHTADVILLIVTDLKQIEEIKKQLKNIPGKRIIIFNNIEKQNTRKISATLQSKKYNFVIIDSPNGVGEDFGSDNNSSAPKALTGGREGNSRTKMRAGRGTLNESIEELKEKIFQNLNKIRVYTKEPGKEPDKNRPVILNPKSTIKDVAEKILHGFSSRVKETRIWGPSSKFSGQITGLNHELKDLDIVEFKTK